MKLHLRFAAILAAGLASASGLQAGQGRTAALPSNAVQSLLWGADGQVTATEPLGRPSGLGLPGGRGYLAVPDTAIFSNGALVLFQTTNYGQTWTSYPQLIPGRNVYRKTKFVHSGLDSEYVFFLRDSVLASWNIATTSFWFFDSTNVIDFDVVASKRGSLHLFVEHPGNLVRQYTSVDGGRHWRNTNTIVNAVMPHASMSAGGDSLVLTVTRMLRPDRLHSPIHLFIYQEPEADSLAFVQGYVMVSDSTRKLEHLAVMNNGAIYFFYAAGEEGAVRLRCWPITVAGHGLDSNFTVASGANSDEIWIDAQPYRFPGPGVDLAWFADSLAGDSSGMGGRLQYAGAGIFRSADLRKAPATVSNHPPVWSARGYSPSLIEYDDTTQETGVIWVGLDGGQRKLYYDRLNAVSVANGVSGSQGQVPWRYDLAQNYPNPFNPSTTIGYTLARTSRVSLAVYDLLGQGVAELVSGTESAGRHEVRFDGSRLASGVYFYRLRAEESVAGGASGEVFSRTRSFLLVK